jgi:hypothetical protein
VKGDVLVSVIGQPPLNPSSTPYVPPDQGKGSGGAKIAILFGIVIALVAANVYLFVQMNSLQTSLNKTRDALIDQMQKMQETASLNTESHRRTVAELREELETARRQANAAVGQAKLDANKHMEQIAAQLQQAQQQATQRVTAKISAVQQDTSTKLGAVNQDIGTVKTDLGSTKSELEKTIANLKVVQGDLSGQGSRIATNQTELDALKQLGERNYFEFTIGKNKQMHKVGNISIELKKADPKHNRYTIDVLADDRRVEKKDKTIDEPVQFLVSGAHQPYEIVVNEVKHNQIKGYLATPKVQDARK